MSAAAAMRLTQGHGELESTLVIAEISAGHNGCAVSVCLSAFNECDWN